MPDRIDYQAHADSYDEASFWKKLTGLARTAGRELVEKALRLFYSAQSPKTPGWARKTIYGALAYLVLPADLVPDFLPAIGLTDDLGVLTAALGTVAFYVDDEVRAQASAKLRDWFGDDAGNPAGPKS